jgi:hypothetical protein
VAFKGTTVQEMDSRSHTYIRVIEIDLDVSRNHSDLKVKTGTKYYQSSVDCNNIYWLIINRNLIRVCSILV